MRKTGVLPPLALGALLALAMTIGTAQPSSAPAVDTVATEQAAQVVPAAWWRTFRNSHGHLVLSGWSRAYMRHHPVRTKTKKATVQTVATTVPVPPPTTRVVKASAPTTSAKPTTAAPRTTTVASAPTTTTAAPRATTTTPAPVVVAPVATTTTPAPVVTAGGTDLRTYGAKCDGTTDDQPAFQRAVTDMVAKHGVLTISGTCRVVRTDTSNTSPLNGAITIQGAGSGATLALDTNRPGAYREMFKIFGAGVTLRNVTLKRVSNSYGVMVSLAGASNLTLDGVTIDGQKDSFSGSDFHGMAIWGGSGNLSNVKITNSTVKNVDYGLFQDSGVTSATNGFTISGSTFTGNHRDDLEFNAPRASMTNVKVLNSTFSGNKSTNSGSGFGVGLANVQQATIQGNSFTGYRFEPLHIEDRSSNVTVSGNTFANSFTAPLNYASHVFVVSGAHDITISDNSFDATANSNRIDCVYAGPGGGAAVGAVSVTNNRFKLKANAKAIGNYGAALKESGNTTSLA